MAKINQLCLEIQDRLANGQRAEYISKVMEIPLYWVTEAEMDTEWSEYSSNFDPQEM